MDTSLISSIINLVVVLLVIGLVAYVVINVRRKSREIAQMAFGTDSLKEGFEKQEREYRETPKSLTSITSLALDRIAEDFPEFAYDEMKARAENVILSYLRCIDENTTGALSEGNDMLREQLRLRLETLRNVNEREEFNNAEIRRTEISRYEKSDGRCLVRFQCAVQSKHFVTDGNKKVIKGNKDKWEQSRWSVDLVYIQDADKLTSPELAALGLNCPNCGAPIKNLGQKFCEYCGTGVIEINIHAWTFSSVREC